MLHHQYRFQFCPVCGERLKSAILKDHEPERLLCPQCDFVFYLDPKLVACAIVEMDSKIVLLKRGIEPEKGKWVMPGGYVDRGEEIEAAVLRETKEECGIDIQIRELLGIYTYPGVVEAVAVYVSNYVGGDLIVGDETADVRLYHPEDIPWVYLAFPSTTDALKDYRKRKEMADRRH